MELSRKISNLIADFRGLPSDESCALFHREVLMHDALKHLCAKYLKGIPKSMNSNLVDNWRLIVGSKYSKYCSPARVLPNGTLVIKVDNSVIRTELCFEISAILSRMNEIGCCDRIRSVKFIL
ncbi:MAG: DUF721 domain-containing protein [Puniceicoccales bacterium]|jgi:hypothetical protein|nr:DUF721 domain-containing protein [Puniceicoccales bacterium]